MLLYGNMVVVFFITLLLLLLCLRSHSKQAGKTAFLFVLYQNFHDENISTHGLTVFLWKQTLAHIICDNSSSVSHTVILDAMMLKLECCWVRTQKVSDVWYTKSPILSWQQTTRKTRQKKLSLLCCTIQARLGWDPVFQSLSLESSFATFIL